VVHVGCGTGYHAATIEGSSISDPGDPVACHDFRGYRENMKDTDVKKLSVNFSQDRDLEAIKGKVLAFLKTMSLNEGLLPA